MKLLITADIHAHRYKNLSRNRLYDIRDAMLWIGDQAREHDVDALVVAGDLFHSRKSLDIDVLYVIAEVIRHEWDDLKVVLLLGNHDISDTGEHNSLMIFEDDCTVVDEPCIVEFDETDVGFIPWTTQKKDVQDSIKLFQEHDCRYVIGHLGIKEGYYQHGVKAKSGIPAGMFKEFSWVVLGHYHAQQKVKNITYVGSPLQLNWGESGDTKSILIAEDDNLEFIENTKSPKFVVVEEKDDLDEISDNDIMQVSESLSDDVQEIPNEDIQIVPDVPESPSPRISFTSSRFTDIIKEWVEVNMPSEEGVSKEELISKGMEYLDENNS